MNQNSNIQYDFSILIPTWNNFPYLKNCIESIEEHSYYSPQLLVFVNEACPESIDYLNKKGIRHLTSAENVGICIAMNRLRPLVKSEIICYLNDDMYVLPEWDKTILEEARKLKTEFFFSATMIEPKNNHNKCTVIRDYGDDLESFKKDKLLTEFRSIFRSDWSGSSWPPLFLKSGLWDKINGFDEAFSPGMYSDPDMAMKAWKVGTRIYKGFGNSLVYHFGSKSTKRLKENVGRKRFLNKWDITSRYFYKHFLHMGETYFGPLKDYTVPIWDRWINKLKK